MLKDVQFPDCSGDLNKLTREELRRLAGRCGLHTSRTTKALLHDLHLICNGKQQEVAMFNWQQSMLDFNQQIPLGKFKYLVNWF